MFIKKYKIVFFCKEIGKNIPKVKDNFKKYGDRHGKLGEDVEFRKLKRVQTLTLLLWEFVHDKIYKVVF